jgi:hypothetical protein
MSAPWRDVPLPLRALVVRILERFEAEFAAEAARHRSRAASAAFIGEDAATELRGAEYWQVLAETLGSALAELRKNAHII